jgi:UDP-N-acetylglucosamine acyltransferase
MSQKIHPSAVIDPKSTLGNNVEIGPFSYIGANVEIGDDTVVRSHAVIEGFTKIGKNNVIFPFTAIGTAPQDLKYDGEDTRIEIGDNNQIREHVTIHSGTKDDNSLTKIGNNCLIMVGAHIAHDCVVGDNVILANNVAIAGHVKVGDRAIIGGLSAVHQFVRIGNNSMIGGMSAVEKDVIPYGAVVGERAHLAGLNIVGLKRAKLQRDEIHALRSFYKEVFENKDSDLISKVSKVEAKYDEKDLVKNVIGFILADSSRAILQPKSTK